MKLKITIENKAYEVEVEVADEQPATAVRYIGGASNGSSVAGPARPSAPVASPGAGGKQPSDEGRAVRSPLAGTVSELNVAVGDLVEVDQAVIVLEAMKMFTTITSPVAGKVKSIEVVKADAVKQGQLLMEFE